MTCEFWDCEICQKKNVKRLNAVPKEYRTVASHVQIMEQLAEWHNRGHKNIEHMVLKHSPYAEVYTNDGVQIDTQEFPYSDNEVERENE